MNGIINRVLLFLFCLIFSLWNLKLIFPLVCTVLTAFVITNLGFYLTRRREYIFFWLLGTIPGLFSHEILYFLPIYIMEWTYWYTGIKGKDNLTPREYLKRLVTLLPLVMITGWHATTISVHAIYLLSFLSLVGICLVLQHNHIFRLEMQMIVNRDATTELTMMLRNKNKYLQEKQDSEIYLATLRERNRIAREIHDNVGHLLSRSLLQIGAIITINKQEDLSPFLLPLKESLDSAMTSIRQSVHDLHDESVDAKEAIREIAEKGLTKFTYSLDYDVTESIPRELKYCLISIVKEGISNIIKHSNGDQVRISLLEHPAFYKIQIYDNGTSCRGKSYTMSKDQGIGLVNITERLETYHGRMTINTNQGFMITVSIPKELGGTNENSYC